MGIPSPSLVVASLLAGDGSALAILSPYFLLSLRIAVVLALTPILYAAPLPASVRVLLVVALSVVLSMGWPLPDSAAIQGAGPLLQAALTEMALGATLALGILVAFAAFSIAGNLLDVQIGFGIGQVFDPVTNRSIPLLASAFNHIAVLVFFLVDGHHALLRGIAFSLQSFPVGAPWPIASSAGAVFKQVGALFAMGFALAAPVAFCILLTELALGVVARNLPQVNMFALGIPVKIVVGLAALSFWFAGMGASMNHVYGSIYTTWQAIFLPSVITDGRRP